MSEETSATANETFDPQALLAKLGISIAEEDAAIMPSGGEAFGASTFIAPWMAFVAYSFMTTEDYAAYNQSVGDDDTLPNPDVRIKQGEWFKHYYRSYADAKTSYDVLVGSEQFRPANVWTFVAETASIVNRDTDALLEGFGDRLVFDTRIQTLRKGSEQFPAVHRHQFGLISLPSAVAAAADAFGIPNVGFSMEEVLDPEAPYTDEWFEGLFGNLEGGYADSVYYARREALWKSLGEPRAEAQAIQGSKTASGKAHSKATTSPQLSACVGLAQGAWSKPLWVELTLVKDPMPGALAKSGNRLIVPTVTRIFQSEAEARAAAAEDGENDGRPAIPTNWASVPNAAEAFMAELAKHDGKPAPTIVEAVAADSAEQVEAWRAYMKAQG